MRQDLARQALHAHPGRSPAAFLPPAAAARPVPSVAAPVPVWRVSATRCFPSSNGKIVAPPPRRTKYETKLLSCESPPKTLIHQGINSPCEVPARSVGRRSGEAIRRDRKSVV